MRWLEWQNVIFLVPLGVGLVLAWLSSTGFGDADLGADADVEVDADADADTDIEAEGEGEPEGGHLGVLSLLGIGRVPLLLLVTCQLSLFGLLGLVANRVSGDVVALSAPVALAGSLAISSVLGRVFARLVPANESYASSVRELAGCTGRVVLLSSATEGFAQVEDPNGNMQEVSCKSVNGSPLSTGQPIVIVRVQSSDRLCLVSPFPGEAS